MKLPADVKKEVLAQNPLQPGQPLPPYPNGTKIEFHFKTLLGLVDVDDQVLVDDTRAMGRPMVIIIGKQFKLEIWELMIHTMPPGQVAKFRVPKHHVASYPMVSKAMRETVSGKQGPSTGHHCCGMMSQQGIGYQDLDKLLQTPQDLTFLFELLTVSPPGDYEQETWQLSEDEKLASIPLLRDEGNALFTSGDFRGAEAKYFDGIARLEQLLLKEHPSSDEARALEAQKVPLLLNYAFCLMKRSEFYESITHFTAVLKLQPANVKGLFRRGKCHKEVGDFKEARNDFKDALSLDPTLSPTIEAMEQEMQTEQRRLDEMDKDRFRRIFNANGHPGEEQST